MKKKKLYVAPLSEEIRSLLAAILCDSGDSGLTEDIGYEDWTIS